MKKLLRLSKMLLMAVGLLGGVNEAWADITETVVVNCDFNNGETLFTEASRISVTNDNNVKFTCADNSQRGYSLATYNFSSVIGTDATAVKIEFLFWIPNQNAAYRRFFTVGQADLRTGFGKTSYSTAGSMFAFGLARNSSANYFSINGASTTAAAAAGSVLGAWARAEIYVDHSAKKVNYKITNVENTTTYYSANDVAFVDGSASYCNQLDFFDCQDNVVSYLDNLVITKYVDNSKVATTYTVKYQNASGTDLKDAVSYDTYVGDTYTASSVDMATFYSGDTNTKYVYKSGNTSAEASATAASNVITLVFDEYAKVSYTVTAKNGESTLGTLASGDAYTDGSTTVYWNKFKQFDGQWYEAASPYGKAITAAGNTDLAFEKSNVAYFYEFETLTRNGGSSTVTEQSSSHSNGKVGRIANSSKSYATLSTPVLSAGTYVLTMPYTNSNTVTEADVFYVYVANDLENLGDPVETFSIEKATKTFETTITVPEGSFVAFQGTHAYSSNSKARVDYLTLTPAPVSATIGSAGWATLYTDKALDFSGVTGLTAYTATCDGSTVTLTPVDDVPANTGVVLKGAGNTYSIPVAASSETAQGDLQGSATATAFNAFSGYDLYMLAKNGSEAQFKKVSSGSIPAGKAFLKVAAKGKAPALDVVFGDATGIEAVKKAETVADGAYYNLAGQRVAQPTKGLYIVNGKKVVIK